MAFELQEKFSQTKKDSNSYISYVASKGSKRNKAKKSILIDINPEYLFKIDKEALQALKNSTVE